MSAHEVLQAAADLVSAFARNDRAAYFGAFTADASFVFYTLPQPLLSRDAYQAVWDSWRRDEGFEVLSCTSSNAVVSLQGDVAIFIHDVATELRMNGEQFFSQAPESVIMPLIIPPQLGASRISDIAMPRDCAQSGSAV